MPQPISNRPTWSEINLENLAANFRSIKEFVGNDVEYLGVVKADAYGHGAVECAKRLEKQGVDWFGVAIPEEGLELREAGITKPILCLGGFWIGQELALLEHELTPVIYSIHSAYAIDQAAGRRGVRANVHIKIDTGMGRIGIRMDVLEEFVKKLRALTNLNVEGVMTHFAAADDLSETDFTDLQIKRFEWAVKVFELNGFTPKYRDLANSPAAVAHSKSKGNMVRIGGILYGLGGDVLPEGVAKPQLKPVLSVYSSISFLKEVPKGESLGYSRTFTTNRSSLIATVPIGYQDGLPRLLSNRGKVLVNGFFAPIVGRISMDWTLIDVTDVPNVKVNDQVIIIGEDNEKSIRAEDIARKVDTISYEITCGINSRVRRVYVGR